MPLPNARLSTLSLHTDDLPHSTHPNHSVAPPLTSSSTYRTPHPQSALANAEQDFEEGKADLQDPPLHIYSRYTDETRTRVEKVLSAITNGNALTYASGLSAAYASVLHYAPRVIARRGGYFGVHVSTEVYLRSHDVKVIDLDDDYPQAEKSKDEKRPWSGGLLVWVESPLNPTGESRDLRHYADKAHAAGGSMIVDSTFGPPGLQDPFKQGADMILHSATKYLGGHSDVLAGVLSVKSKQEWLALWHDRTYVGVPPGSLESWLLLRSLRTLKVRVAQQSSTATELVRYLTTLVSPSHNASHVILSSSAEAAQTSEGLQADKEIRESGIVRRVWHGSLQPRQDKDELGRKVEGGQKFDPKEQMSGGWNPCFSIRLSEEKYARYLPHATQYFIPATSLGGVESLMEWRKAAESTEEPGLVRISVGLEDINDLIEDVRDSLLALSRGERLGDAKNEARTDVDRLSR
ncbi:Cystathionine beta-lyases/cystathionine gamma-synthases [Ceraceosorus bombacis]|uniref:Cystathionine beta-lyases/cystathionine gamma-synthases n=1 Tax=Ceraceosorus bombacis TaxID=401625 RepID=A0A0P1BN72_9BASI|nr:Cystathionine beta-lyases/cystathionine gamma-synthases [Ceraceosorus bombacis]